MVSTISSITIYLSVQLLLTFVSCTTTITGWTNVYPQPTTDWNQHRGFFSSSDNKIYLIGLTSPMRPLVFDIAANSWSMDDSFGSIQYCGQEAQHGAVIGTGYYMACSNVPGKVYKFDNVHSIWNTDFADIQATPTKCMTSNGVDSLYAMYWGKFQRLDVTAPSPRTFVDGYRAPHYVSYSTCAYYNGFVYLFHGQGSNKIQKINVGLNNEYWETATWEVLPAIMPVTGCTKGQAVLANDNKIYILGFAETACKRSVFSFDPSTDTISIEPLLNFYHEGGAIVFSEYDAKIYAIGGASYKKHVERSNEIPAAPECVVDSDCGDFDECTDDTCVNGECVYTQQNCDDGLACTEDTCFNGECQHSCPLAAKYSSFERINDDKETPALIGMSSENKDVLIISLLVSHVLMVVGCVMGCILWRKSKYKYSKYEIDNVDVMASTDDEHRQLQS